MKRGLIGMLLLSAPASAQPAPTSPRAPGTAAANHRIAREPATQEIPRAKPPRSLETIDVRLREDSKLVAPRCDDWHLAAWATPISKPVVRAKRKVTLAPASMSGGRGIKIKIPI